MKQVKMICITFTLLQTYLFCQGISPSEVTRILELRYISPIELREELATQYFFDEHNEISINGSKLRCAFNNSTNQVLLRGDSAIISKAIELIKFLDVPPRQIVIEAKIVAIDNDRLNELGMDWQTFLDNTTIYGLPDIRWEYNRVTENGSEVTDRLSHTRRFEGSVYHTMRVGDLLKIIKEKKIGRIVSVPKIVTTNNKKGSILDGSRITYVTRYSSYANVYETQEMSAGLMLSVTPSLGESGYIKLVVSAKLTQLGEIIAGSPSEKGQIIENTVIVKDGEEFLLGGFKTEEKNKYKRKVPILGTILPFLFSRTVETEKTRNFLIVLKPTVIDLKSSEIPNLE